LITDAIATAAGIVAIGGAAVAAYGGGLRTYRRTIGSRCDLAGRLNRLACGTTGAYVGNLLGIPAFQKSIGFGIEAPPATEYTYATKHAWVQVTIGAEDGVVLCFAITVTDRHFRFRIRDLTFDHLDIRLGHDRFDALDHQPTDTRLVRAARRYHYAEAHRYGNPGGYQTYVLAAMDSGIGWRRVHALPAGRAWATEGFQTTSGPIPPVENEVPENLAVWRHGLRVDTLRVIGPTHLSGTLASEWPGADLDQVRLLRPVGLRAVNRRRIKRRIRRSQ